QAGVVPVRWGTFLAEHPCGRAPFFRDLAGTMGLAPPRHVAPTADVDGVRARWERAPLGERPALLIEVLRDLIARVTGAPASQVDVETSLVRMGLDSLMAVEMRHVLHRALGVDVAVVALMQAASVGRLADDLGARMGDAGRAATPARDGDVVE